MGRKHIDEIELSVSNKNLLTLFFVVVVFFSGFFFWGYTIGFGHGERTEPTELASLGEIAEPGPEDSLLPRALLEAPPKVESVEAPKPKPAPVKAAEVKPSAVKPTAAKPTTKPPARKPVAASKPAPKPSAKGLHLQVAALRVGKDAKSLAGRLKSKGYSATVNESLGDGWFRVVVGPFGSIKAAEDSRKRLAKDGFDSMARRF